LRNSTGGGQFTNYGQDYLFALLESRIMPLVDAVTFHPLYNITPQNEEIQKYAIDVDYGPPEPEAVQAFYDNYPDLQNSAILSRVNLWIAVRHKRTG